MQEHNSITNITQLIADIITDRSCC